MRFLAIVAFTFTEKGAAELKERIISRRREELEDVHGLAEMYVGTIHAFCLKFLKTEVPEYLKFDVLNEVQQKLFIDRHSKTSGLTASTDLEGRSLRRFTDTHHYINATSILREARTKKSMLRSCSIVSGLESYRELLISKKYFDYSSILEAAADSIRKDRSVRDRLSKRIRHVIVDEYQDVNPIQEEIVGLLNGLGAHICVVGDDDQTVYQWRGSNVQGILKFQERYG